MIDDDYYSLLLLASNENNNHHTNIMNYNEQSEIYRKEFEKIYKKWNDTIDVNDNITCNCDQSFDYCDINCCCDHNCTDIDRYSFDKCLPSLNDDFNHNNDRQQQPNQLSPCKSSPFLCLAKDNTFSKQTSIHHRTIITETAQLNRLPIKHCFRFNQNHFPLKIEQNNNDDEDEEEDIGDNNEKIIDNLSPKTISNIVRYKSGYSLIRFRFVGTKQSNSNQNKSLKNPIIKYYKWRLPISANNNDYDCNKLMTIKYLHDYQSTCNRIIDWNLCTADNKYFNYQTFLHLNDVFLSFDNQTQTNNVSAMNNSNNFKFLKIDINQQNFEPIYFDNETNICHNLVEQVDYVIWHNGIYGIQHIQIRLKQIDLSLTTENFGIKYMIQQRFNVTFRWYQRRLPIRNNDLNTNYKINHKNGYEFGDDLKFFRIDTNHSNINPMHMNNFLINSYTNGECIKSNQKMKQVSLLKFGWNRFDQCHLWINLTSLINNNSTNNNTKCVDIKSYVNQYLHQDFFIENIANDDSNGTNGSYISIGSYPINNLSLKNNETILWIRPLFHEINSTFEITDNNRISENEKKKDCFNYNKEGFINELIYNFYINRINEQREKHYYQLIGAEILQKKIIINANKHNNLQMLSIDLRTMVNFIDVSEKFVPEYALKPSFRLELPSDFFYPFISHAHPMIISSFKFIFISILISLFNVH